MEREIAGYDVTEIENFVVKRSDQYIERFERLAQNKRPKFNWAAALFDGLWLGYRKMWIESLVYYVIYYTTCNLIISAIVIYLSKIGVIDESTAYWLIHIPDLIQFIFMGFVGDKIYWRNVRKRIEYSHIPKEIRENKIGFLAIHKESKGTSIGLGAVPMLFWREVMIRIYGKILLTIAYFIAAL
ncbi:MAG: DUF2628 domain-containing protein [Clostridiales bacterium]|nr:DUF2628 domain-containing protein [Clostridiales bacterium]